MDRDLGAARKARWNKAFSEDKPDEAEITSINRKATSEYLFIAVVLLAPTCRMRGQRFLTMRLVVF